MRSPWIAVAALLCFASIAFSQTGNAILGGTVVDASGVYHYPSLQPGKYKVSSELPGFQKQTYGEGSAGVSGSAFITLAATLTSIGKIPVAGMVLLLGVDMFMAQARSITNTIGNSVATIVVGKWVRALDEERIHDVLDHELSPEELKVLYES